MAGSFPASPLYYSVRRETSGYIIIKGEFTR